MSEAVPAVVNDEDPEKLWFLGTLAQIKLDGQTTDGRLAVFEGLFPRGANATPPRRQGRGTPSTHAVTSPSST